GGPPGAVFPSRRSTVPGTSIRGRTRAAPPGREAPEDVADEARVFAPGHPELEFLDQTGGHAHDGVDEEELAEELRAAQIDLIAGAVIDRLQDRDEHPESQSQRHHPEVVDGGDSELP